MGEEIEKRGLPGGSRLLPLTSLMLRIGLLAVGKRPVSLRSTGQPRYPYMRHLIR